MDSPVPEEEPAPGDPIPALRGRIQAIEEGYEFFLAYAAQGLETDSGSGAGAELRGYLEAMEGSVRGLEEAISTIADGEALAPEAAEPMRELAQVIAADARKAGAALRLVAAQPAISSQLVDNLNGSIHLRALLMDLYLLDEVLKEADRRAR